MAIDNLNFYSNWLPAWQQTDKYSSQPWCLRSKNLDIFSSSKSVKATAWSTPVNTAESWVVLVDQTGNLILKSDWGVYDRISWTEVLVKSGIASNFPSYDVSYNWWDWTFAPAQWGTEKQLISKYENWVLKYFTIITDKARYIYSTEEYKVSSADEIWSSTKWTLQSGGYWKKSDGTASTYIRLKLDNLQWLTSARLTLQAYNSNYAAQGHLLLNSIRVEKPRYWYNAETEQMEYKFSTSEESITIVDQLDDANGTVISYDIPLLPVDWDTSYYLSIGFRNEVWTDNTKTWADGELWLDVKWYNDAYNYLPENADRELVDIWEYYWEKAPSFQTLYSWSGEWTNDDNKQRVVRYSLEKYMGWANDVSMDIIWMIAWNEQIYMIWNMNWNWYIFPCDLSWGRGTPFIAYWCTFKWATNIDYLLYLVWEDRGISQLWVYNGQELVAILWWNKEKSLTDYVDTAEQYKFDWKMVEYRGDLVLTTTDNRVFQYGQTFWGKWWAFIHQLPWTITELRARDNDLNVRYTASGVNYITTYQDDIIAKNYNTEWEAEYPIQIWNHLIEKEDSDLYASYILPNSNCKLEFWGMANHYHFWTFKSSDSYTFSTTASYKMKGCTWNYALKFIEKNNNRYTFRLEGDLPLQTVSGMKITDTEWTELITYSEYNHFRKIWEITTDGYQEWEFRFHNLNNKLELPRSHSLQIMVRGKGTANYTPELFAVDLVANQRDRW